MKIRRVAGVFFTVIFFFSAVGYVSAVSLMKRFDKGTQTCREFTWNNARAGYLIFRSVCKSCHHEGNQEGARFLYSESKTQEGWNRVFEELYPECAKSGAWDGLDLEDRLNLNDYLFVDSAGTFNPNEVGYCFS